MSRHDILLLNEKLESIDFAAPWSQIISKVEDVKRELLDIFDNNIFAPTIIHFLFSSIYRVTARQPNDLTLDQFKVRDGDWNIFRIDDSWDIPDTCEYNYLLKPKVYLWDDSEPSSVIVMNSRAQTRERINRVLDLIESEIWYRTSRKK